MDNKISEWVKKFFNRLVDYVILIGLIGLILGVINLIKGESGYAQTGFAFFGTAVLFLVLSKIFERISGKKKSLNLCRNLSEQENKTAIVLGILVLLERPFDNKNDETILKHSILNQQKNEFYRLISANALVKFRVAGASLDDEAYIYGVCRSEFEDLSTWANNDEFLQRVAIGSFTASDGNCGKHFVFLDH